MRTRIIVAVMVIALIALGAQGCKSASERLAEELIEGGSGTEVDIDDEGKSITIEGDGTSTTINSAEGELAKDWPDDVPVYDGTIISSSSSVSEDAALFSVTLETDDDGSQVREFYEKELADEGWDITFNSDMSSGGERSYSVMAEKGDWSVVVAITERDATTEVSVTAGK